MRTYLLEQDFKYYYNVENIRGVNDAFICVVDASFL